MAETSLLPTAETTYGHPSGVPVARRAAVSQARGRGVILPADSETAPDPVLTARVNHGRWLVDCPFCGGAQVASLTDPRFLCADCFNRAIGGLMLSVVWPKDRQAIETELVKRERDDQRNWYAAETVDDLVAEREAVEAGQPPERVLSDRELIAALAARVEVVEVALARLIDGRAQVAESEVRLR